MLETMLVCCEGCGLLIEVGAGWRPENYGWICHLRGTFCPDCADGLDLSRGSGRPPE